MIRLASLARRKHSSLLTRMHRHFQLGGNRALPLMRIGFAIGAFCYTVIDGLRVAVFALGFRFFCGKRSPILLVRVAL